MFSSEIKIAAERISSGIGIAGQHKCRCSIDSAPVEEKDHQLIAEDWAEEEREKGFSHLDAVKLGLCLCDVSSIVLVNIQKSGIL
jgi:hypothetical protein